MNSVVVGGGQVERDVWRIKIQLRCITLACLSPTIPGLCHLPLPGRYYYTFSIGTHRDTEEDDKLQLLQLT